MAKAIPKSPEAKKEVTLNKLGLAKVVEYLKSQFPGIENILIIVDEGIAIEGTDIRLTASTLITEELPAPAPSPTPTPASIANSSSPSKPLSQPLDPALQKSPSKDTSTIGKMPGSQVKAIGRAGADKQKEQQTQQMVDRLRQFFPDKAQLQQALIGIAQNLGQK